MKILFENDIEKEQFKSWLLEVQGYACDIDLAINGSFPKPVEEAKLRASASARHLWYRIFDIDAEKL